MTRRLLRVHKSVAGLISWHWVSSEAVVHEASHKLMQEELTQVQSEITTHSSAAAGGDGAWGPLVDAPWGRAFSEELGGGWAKCWPEEVGGRPYFWYRPKNITQFASPWENP